MPDYSTNVSKDDLNFNPYNTSFETLKRKVSLAEDDVATRRRLLDWYRSLNGGAQLFKERHEGLREIERLESELQSMPSEVAQQRKRLEVVRNDPILGNNPFYWFSSARSEKKTELSKLETIVKQMTADLAKLQHRLKTVQESTRKLDGELERYRKFDILEAEATEKELNRQVVQLRNELGLVQTLKEEFDQELIVPRRNLMDLIKKKEILENDLSYAKRLESSLSAASDGYERKMIHEECENKFGESKPARVINELRKKIEPINRNIEKDRERLRLETQRALLRTRVKTIVIDGSNLCYDGKIFIGLPALQVVTRELSRKFRVLVVFDASIRKKLRMDDEKISYTLGSTLKVHVMANKQTADEMVLDAAAAADAWIISNDRFGEFPDKPAIREGRVIRHEILDNEIKIFDLRFTGSFSRDR